jgi:AcrR family transcriptional regulator
MGKVFWEYIKTLGKAHDVPLAPADVYDAILDAAERLLARYGYRKMTMDDLAREAGIGKGTKYLHFPSKQEVVLCSIDQSGIAPSRLFC